MACDGLPGRRAAGFLFLILPLGKTDIWGNASLEIPVHKMTPPFEMKAQAISWGFSLLPWPTTGFCTSNVADIKVGDVKVGG